MRAPKLGPQCALHAYVLAIAAAEPEPAWLVGCASHLENVLFNLLAQKKNFTQIAPDPARALPII
jgi:hypothetical protein